MWFWNAIRLFGKSVADFFRDGGFMLAAAISYFSIMAIVPFCLFLIAVFAYLLGVREDFFTFIASKLVNFFPKAAQTIAHELREIISYHGVGVLTFSIYGILSYQLYSSLENAINVVFKVKERRTFLSHFFISTVIFTLIIALLLVSFGATSLVPLLNELKEELPLLRMNVIISFIVRYVVPFILVFLTLAMLYHLLPKRKVLWRNAFQGALVTALLLELAKHFFTVYVVKVSKLGAIYGPLSAFIFFLLWVFYSSCLFLIGAEVVHNLETKKGANGAPVRKRK